MDDLRTLLLMNSINTRTIMTVRKSTILSLRSHNQIISLKYNRKYTTNNTICRIDVQQNNNKIKSQITISYPSHTVSARNLLVAQLLQNPHTRIHVVLLVDLHLVGALKIVQIILGNLTLRVAKKQMVVGNAEGESLVFL